MKIIGVSGLARSGKDTIALSLKKEIQNFFPNKTVEIIPLALALKSEMSNFIQENFNIELALAEGEAKEILRPLMVAYGYAKRQLTQGRYFIDAFEKAAQNQKADFYIIPDIRYCEFEADELSWLKNKQGILVHVEKFSLDQGKRKFLKPPNQDEAKNNPKLKKASDYRVCWEHCDDEKKLVTVSRDEAQRILEQHLTWFVK